MVTIGIDPHEDTHQAVAVDDVLRQLDERKYRAATDGFGELPRWSRSLSSDRVWVLEDHQPVSGPLERFLLDHGETVVRLPRI
jgi:transposase